MFAHDLEAEWTQMFLIYFTLNVCKSAPAFILPPRDFSWGHSLTLEHLICFTKTNLKQRENRLKFLLDFLSKSFKGSCESPTPVFLHQKCIFIIDFSIADDTNCLYFPEKDCAINHLPPSQPYLAMREMTFHIAFKIEE